jgi:tRNA threonylcarbamoyladenosine modification (KEOPS) complex Cgi121 subunit
LLKTIKEFKKQILVTGLRNAKINDVDEFLKKINEDKTSEAEIQVFNAKRIATWQHMYFAALNAIYAFKNKKNISNSLAMEIMLYASAQHQIRKATEILGIKPDSTEIALLIIGENTETINQTLAGIMTHIQAKRDETVLELSDDKRTEILQVFGISDVEIRTRMKSNELNEALISCVIERVALLATEH